MIRTNSKSGTSENIQVAVRVRPSKKKPTNGDDFGASMYAIALDISDIERKETYDEGSDYYMCVRMPDRDRVQLITQRDAEDSSRDRLVEWSFPHCFWSHDNKDGMVLTCVC